MSTLTAPWLVVAALLAVGCTDLVGGPQQAPERLVSDWTGPDGELASRSVRDFEAITTRGPQHCELESVVFLKLGWPVGTTVAADSPEEAMREYVRDPDGLLQDYRVTLLGSLQVPTELPADANPTGYSLPDARLWLGPDEGDTYVYLESEDGTVERWPRLAEPFACG